MLRYLLVLLFGLVSAASAQTNSGTAAPAAEAPAELVSALVEHLQVVETLTVLKRAMSQPDLFEGVGDDTMQKKVSVAWTTTVNTVLDIEKVAASVRSDIARSFTAGDLEWHRSFYGSELGKRLTKVGQHHLEAADQATESASLLADTLLQAEEIQKELDADPVRTDALKRLVAATGGEQAYLDVILSIADTLKRAATAAAPSGAAGNRFDEMMQAAEQYRPMLQMLVQPMILPAFAKLYEPLATSEIESFAVALETPQGRRMTSGLAQMTGRIVGRLVVEFTAELKRQSETKRD